jgi:hypothetical protein
LKNFPRETYTPHLPGHINDLALDFQQLSMGKDGQNVNNGMPMQIGTSYPNVPSGLVGQKN